MVLDSVEAVDDVLGKLFYGDADPDFRSRDDYQQAFKVHRKTQEQLGVGITSGGGFGCLVDAIPACHVDIPGCGGP